jgi:hypothetical protein
VIESLKQEVSEISIFIAHAIRSSIRRRRLTSSHRIATRTAEVVRGSDPQPEPHNGSRPGSDGVGDVWDITLRLLSLLTPSYGISSTGEVIEDDSSAFPAFDLGGRYEELWKEGLLGNDMESKGP